MLEEYAEGFLLLAFVEGKGVADLASLGPLLDPDLDAGAYLGGLIDFTGEVTRVWACRVFQY